MRLVDADHQRERIKSMNLSNEEKELLYRFVNTEPTISSSEIMEEEPIWERL